MLIPAGVAAAHPLGNFTINHFARVEVAGDTLYVRYVVDMAEIDPDPAGRRPAVRRAQRPPRRPPRAAPHHPDVARPRAAAGLRTTRFEAVLAGPRVDGRTRVDVADSTYAGRTGWKEIVVGAHTRSASVELRAYPNELVRARATSRT
ncbi:MAG TPA: hypothetical protein VK278_08015 [Gaiellaceae bacterium]|nr:hypothetical protein [Gaiellaceae bacterium]